MTAVATTGSASPTKHKDDTWRSLRDPSDTTLQASHRTFSGSFDDDRDTAISAAKPVAFQFHGTLYATTPTAVPMSAAGASFPRGLEAAVSGAARLWVAGQSRYR